VFNQLPKETNDWVADVYYSVYTIRLYNTG